jgi:hypothetical protein
MRMMKKVTPIAFPQVARKESFKRIRASKKGSSIDLMKKIRPVSRTLLHN